MHARGFIVTPPRSGQHMFTNWLEVAFGRQLSYCEFYTCMDNRGLYRECEARHWPAAMRIGCRSGCQFQKNHDFDLQMPISGQFRYVVIYRHPVMSMSSWWKLEGKAAGDDLSDFMFSRVEYWVRFIRKWVLSDISPSNRLVLRYEDLTKDPSHMRAAATFLNGGMMPYLAEHYDDKFLSVEAFPEKKVENERHFSLEVFRELEHRIGADLIKQLGYTPMFIPDAAT